MSIEVSVLFAMLSYFYCDTDHHDMYFLPYSFYDHDNHDVCNAGYAKKCWLTPFPRLDLSAEGLFIIVHL